MDFASFADSDSLIGLRPTQSEVRERRLTANLTGSNGVVSSLWAALESRRSPECLLTGIVIGRNRPRLCKYKSTLFEHGKNRVEQALLHARVKLQREGTDASVG